MKGTAASLHLGPVPLSHAGSQTCFPFFVDHVLYSGKGCLHPGLQCLADLPYNRKRHSLPLQVSSRNEQFCKEHKMGQLPI